MIEKYTKNIIKKSRELYINGYSQEEICKKLNIPHGSIWKFLKDIPTNKRKKLPKLFRPKYQLPINSKYMSKEKARIIGYLASEGHVRLDEGYDKKLRPFHKSNGIGYRLCKHKNALISFYNTEIILIKKYMKDFYKVYKIKTKYIKKEYEVKIRSVEVYKDLIRYCKFGSRDWYIPKGILNNKTFSKEWLKAFCDGEAYIDNKSKRIVINSVNKKGLISIKKLLEQLNIKSKIYGPYYWKKFKSFRITIKGKDNLIKFNKNITF